MFKLPKKIAKEKKEASISVRVRPTVLERLKWIAEKHNYSQSEVIEFLVDQAFEEITKKKEAGKRNQK